MKNLQETMILNDLIKEPLQDNLQTLSNHLGRYYYALKKLDIRYNDFVLDVGCGQGYGTYLLSQYSKDVIGEDLNEEFLRSARFNFKDLLFVNINENYIYKGITKILCIEIIEHLEKNKIKPFLKRLYSFLMPNGEMFLTFPIGENKLSKYNPYHKCEPSIEFIYNIINKYFTKIKIEIDQFINNYGYNQKYCIMVAK